MLTNTNYTGFNPKAILTEDFFGHNQREESFSTFPTARRFLWADKRDHETFRCSLRKQHFKQNWRKFLQGKRRVDVKPRFFENKPVLGCFEVAQSLVLHFLVDGSPRPANSLLRFYSSWENKLDKTAWDKCCYLAIDLHLMETYYKQ